MEQTLNLFVELANGYSSVKNLRKSETVKKMLLNHAAEHYSFLEHDYKSKNRTKYYAALTKVLFAGDADLQEADFNAFGNHLVYL
jgi:exportin-7